MLAVLTGLDSDAGLRCYAAMLRRLLPQLEMLCACTGSPPVAISDAECITIAGDPLDGLLEATAAYCVDLILVGQSTQDRKRALVRRLAMKAPCSIWMVPEGAPPVLGKILAPIDFSRRSAGTLGIATALTEASGADECLALHVHFNDAAVTFDEFDEILAEDQYHAFGIFVAPIDLHGVFARPLFIEAANVAQAIVRTASEEHCGLIVMGTRGRSTSAAVLLGSETEDCMMTTQIPLLAVKQFGARLPLLKALRDERLRRRGVERFT
jgi:nucleotide-binding universal stress UspA family protein